jgi:hypothetical protein
MRVLTPYGCLRSAVDETGESTGPAFLDRERAGEEDVVFEMDVAVEVGLEVPEPCVKGLE